MLLCGARAFRPIPGVALFRVADLAHARVTSLVLQVLKSAPFTPVLSVISGPSDPAKSPVKFGEKDGGGDPLRVMEEDHV